VSYRWPPINPLSESAAPNRKTPIYPHINLDKPRSNLEQEAASRKLKQFILRASADRTPTPKVYIDHSSPEAGVMALDWGPSFDSD
jgi:hypothetical protein